MADILKTLLEVTVYSGVLLIVILVLKRIFRKQLSASLHYLVWLLLVARLLMPVTIDSGLTLFVLPEEPVEAVQNVAADEQTAPDIRDNGGVTAFAAQPEVVINDTPAYSGGAAAASPAAARISVDWAAVAIFAWALGMVVYFFFLAWLHVRFGRILRRGTGMTPGWVTEMTEACQQELGIRRRIRVCVQDSLNSPALTLSLRPRLLLPQSMMDNMSRGQVALGIRHELTHYKRKDHLMSLLLLILRGVYWFNPIVWITQRMMLSDMEAACDARATLGLEKRQRNLYVSTIIDLGCDRYAHCALGMGAGNGKKQMERRIRGMFQKRKSGHAARLTAALLVPLLLVACFTTACQPTPEEPIIKDKGQDLSGYVAATPEATASAAGQAPDTDALYEKLGAPRHWQMETQEMDGKLNISADVDVELPPVSALPAATAVLREFSQEEINNIVRTVLGDGLVFTESVDWTKESLQAKILEIKQNIALQQEGKEPGTGVYYSENDLEHYESLLADAPAEGELKTKDLSVETISEGQWTYQGIRVNTVADGQPYVILAGNSILPEAVHSIHISTSTGYGAYFSGTYLDEPYGVALTKEEASAQAQAIASQLTDELTLCAVMPTATTKDETERNWGWACVFMREINGCPTAFATEDVGTSMETTVQQPIRYEKMVIVLDDMGVTSFTWTNPMTATSIDNADVAVLAFDEIAQVAVTQLAVRNKWSVQNDKGEDVDPGCTVRVTKVELGLMRVMKADSNEYYYIPVWNFFSEVEHTGAYYDKYGKGKSEEEVTRERQSVDEKGNPYAKAAGYPQAWGAVTLSALDGSVINRDLGY